MRSEDVKYVIIQAGGKGIRMGRYAENKPKCLVPVKGIPMIMNTIEKYKDKEIIIIADYKADVLEVYLSNFCKHNFTVCQTTEQGTAGGLAKVMDSIPDDEPFILTWADLFFEETPEFEFDKDLLVGLSDTFKCRWKLENNKFIEDAYSILNWKGLGKREITNLKKVIKGAAFYLINLKEVKNKKRI